MAPKRGNSNKGRTAGDSDDSFPEVPQSKKQITSDKRGAPVPAKKEGRKHDEVIDLESPQYLIAPRKLMAKGDDFQRDAFPRFHGGTVYIQLVELHNKYTYTLHKDILERASSKLATIFQGQVSERDSAMAKKVKVRAGLEFVLDLQFVQNQNTFALVRVPFTVFKPPQRDQDEKCTSVQPTIVPKTSKPSGLQTSPSPKSLKPILNEPLPTPRSVSPNLLISSIEDKAALTSPRTGSEVEVFSSAHEILKPIDKSPESEASSVIPATAESDAGGATNRSEDQEIDLEVENTILAIEREGEDGVIPTVESAAKTKSDDGGIPRSSIKLEAQDGVITIIKSAIRETNDDSQITEMENTQSALQDSNSTTADMIKCQKSTMNDASNNAVMTIPNFITEEEISHAFVEITEPTSNPNMELKSSEATQQESASTDVNMIRGSTPETIQLAAAPKTELKGLESTIHVTTSIDTTKFENPTIGSPRYAHGEMGEGFAIQTNNSSHQLDDMEVRRQKSIEAHHNLFLIFYNYLPELDNNDVNNAFDQIEQIVLIGNIYRCIHVLRYCLIDRIFQLFSHELCKAILDNPPRWLLLSIDLSCAPIFKEAIVHLVGNYPHYPWTEYPPSKIPSQILNLIRKKVDKLRTLKASIDEELFASSIAIKGKSLTFTENFGKPGFRTWFVVQIWQDWLRQSMWKHTAAKNGVGSTYRLLARGGNAYLDHRDVYDKLIADKCNGDSSWDKEDVEVDLNIMKDFAQKKVKNLVINNSMLDVEESGIQHLTCTYIRNDELPWVNNNGA